MRLHGREVLLPTTMVGSWPRPLWLRGAVLSESVYEPDYVDMHQRTLFEDAVRLCVKDQDLAGLDIVTDGNQYFQGETRYDKAHWLLLQLRLQGFRPYGPPGPMPGMEHYYRPVVHDRIRWIRPVFGPVLEALRRSTDKPVKLNINSGPAFVAGWCDDQYYGDPQALRADVADAFNTELRWLADHGADVLQLTEQAYLWSGGSDDWAVELMNRTAHGVDAHLTWHMCYGNARELGSLYPDVEVAALRRLFESDLPIDWPEIHMETARPEMAELEVLATWTIRDGTYLGIGVVEAMSPRVETAEEVASRIRSALGHVDPGRLFISTDCGLYQLAHDIAFRKLCNLVEGTRIVRTELGRRADGTR